METIKQIFQNLNTGLTQIMELPYPECVPNHLLIESKNSLISSGTEKMLVDFSKANLIQKAKSQPDKIKQVIDKIRTDGFFETYDAVKSKLDQPLPLGYSNVGILKEIGKGIDNSEFQIGDRILSNGPHSEICVVPKNLCVKIPENVSFEEASFGVLGAIGLQGIRLANPQIGECFVVYGLGLIGLLTLQILIANGCSVIGIDINNERLKLAEKFGAVTINLKKVEDPVQITNTITKSKGVDGVIITASTQSNDPVHISANICRKRGRIVLVGVTGLKLNRSDFYEKELSFQVSCSYGPGRYDPIYESKGIDYPLGFVRWTEKRNFETILELLSSKKLNVKPLISHKFDINDSTKAYDLISNNIEEYLGIILEYNKSNINKTYLKTIELKSSNKETLKTNQIIIGFIGAGNFANRILLPSIIKNKVKLKTIVSSKGISSTHTGKKFNFLKSSTDIKEIFTDNEVNTVFISTRHNSHASLIIEALKTKKHVFTEKPLCIQKEELNQIKEVFHNLKSKQVLFIGFNRRFSPFIQKIKELLKSDISPKNIIITVNAGFIPYDNWIQDPLIGGGRIIGEVCHFIDLVKFLTNENFNTIYTSKINKENLNDNVSISITMSNGSIATIHYFTNGTKSYPKEKIEIFSNNKVLLLDNFRSLKGYNFKKFSKLNTLKQDKGHFNEINEFFNYIKHPNKCPITFDEIYEVMLATFAAKESYDTGEVIRIKD